MWRKHLNGLELADLMMAIGFHETLAKPGKNELLCSNEEVFEGLVFYFAENYYEALLISINEAISIGTLQEHYGEEKSVRILQAIQTAELVQVREDIKLKPHIYAM